jgi:hypothetical protein
MTVFPQELHWHVDGCMHTLTRTTENQSSQARVRGYYYVPSNALRCGSLSRILPLRGRFVDTLVSQVLAWYRAPTHEATSRAHHITLHCRVSLEGAGQRACTVPTSTTNTVLCFALLTSSPTGAEKWKPIHPCPKERMALSSRPMNGNGSSRAGLLKHVESIDRW